MSTYVQPFSEIDNQATASVGGKNASLGEMFNALSAAGIRVPDGFATTDEAFWQFIAHNDLKEKIKEELDQLDTESFDNLSEVGKTIRGYIREAEMPEDIATAIHEHYEQLAERETDLESVAVRSSATAEDLPEASFAGQHDSFLNVTGPEATVKAVQNCMASLYTDRAIKYREEKGFDHLKIALSAGVQKMVRSDEACAGVAFTIDPDSGFEEVLFINGAWGLGDNVVGGVVNADQFYLYKENLERGVPAIISKQLGSKEQTLVYTDEGEAGEQQTENQPTPEERQHQFILSDAELTELGHWCLEIEKHYERPMDIEWAKDGLSDELYIVQARPETVHSQQQDRSRWHHYKLRETGEVILTGSAIGHKIAAGKARILDSPTEADKLEEGDILVTTQTSPDWDPILRKASAIITDSGGRTSHAAIVARELGAVAVIGTENGTERLEDGQEITVSCVEGSDGKVYAGRLEWDEEEVDVTSFDQPETDPMLILGNPIQAFQYAPYPVAGVGLMRLEFAIANSIRTHPLALVRFDELEDEDVRREIETLTAAYPDKESYFVEQLSMAVATVAAAFHPRPVIVRMSDFKSNEYADLLGGRTFEPEEANPMLGFRGAARYYDERYRPGFELECAALRRVRDELQFDNVILMVPFCRQISEADRVLEVLADNRLVRGHNGLEIYMMVEIPSNVLGLEELAERFDGFSIGSNDLTQLVLGVDRDSDLMSEAFDERNPQVKKMIARAIEKARAAGRPIGLCGQAPSDFPDYARFLVEQGIDTISFIPDALPQGVKNILAAESEQ